MPRQISIFAGSFKPPHKGHLAIVKKMLKLTEKPRKGDKGP
jgi:nicotinic acid mononucleotide adenylyltransferase